MDCGTFFDHLIDTSLFCLVERFTGKRISNTGILYGTKAEKATTPAVPSPTRIAGRCEAARGTFSDPGPLSCYNIANCNNLGNGNFKKVCKAISGLIR